MPEDVGNSIHIGDLSAGVVLDIDEASMQRMLQQAEQRLTKKLLIPLGVSGTESLKEAEAAAAKLRTTTRTALQEQLEADRARAASARAAAAETAASTAKIREQQAQYRLTAEMATRAAREEKRRNQDGINGIENEVRAYRNLWQSRILSNDQVYQQQARLRQQALEMALVVDKQSDAYRRLTQIAAAAQRTMDASQGINTPGGFGYGVSQGITNAFGQFGITGDLITGFIQLITAKRAVAKSEAAGLGQDTIAGLIAGMKNSQAQVKAEGKIAGDSVANAIRDSLDIHSPSRVTEYLGRMAGLGFVTGVKSMQAEAKAAAAALSGAATTGLSTPMNTASSSPVTAAANAVGGNFAAGNILASADALSVLNAQLAQNTSVTETAGEAQEEASGSIEGLGDTVSTAAEHVQSLRDAHAEEEEASRRAALNEAKTALAFTATAAAVTATAAAMVASFNAAADYEKAMAGAASTTEATTAELAQLDTVARSRRLSDLGIDAKEAAGGIEELGSQGLATADIVGGGLVTSLTLAKAVSTEVSTAAAIAAASTKAFGLEAKDLARVGDVVTNAVNATSIKIENFSDAIAAGGSQAKASSMDFTEFTAAISFMTDKAISASDAGTAFKTFLQSLTPNSKAAANEMKRLGFNAFDAQGNFKSLAEIADNLQRSLGGLSEEERAVAEETMFGSDAARVAQALREQGNKGVLERIDLLNRQGTMEEAARRKMEGARGEQEKFNAALENFKISVGNTFLPAGTKMLEWADGFIGKLDAVLQKLEKVKSPEDIHATLKIDWSKDDATTAAFKLILGTGQMVKENTVNPFQAMSNQGLRTRLIGAGLMKETGFNKDAEFAQLADIQKNRAHWEQKLADHLEANAKRLQNAGVALQGAVNDINAVGSIKATQLPPKPLLGEGPLRPGQQRTTANARSFFEAIFGQETGGKGNTYGVVNGIGALGKYQVMAQHLLFNDAQYAPWRNTGAWFNENRYNRGGKGQGWDYLALGKDITPDEYLKNPAYQELIAQWQMGANLQKRLNQANGNLEIAVKEAAKDWYGRGKALPGHPTPDQYASSVWNRFLTASGKPTATPTTPPSTNTPEKFTKSFDAYIAEARRILTNIEKYGQGGAAPNAEKWRVASAQLKAFTKDNEMAAQAVAWVQSEVKRTEKEASRYGQTFDRLKGQLDITGSLEGLGQNVAPQLTKIRKEALAAAEAEKSRNGQTEKYRQLLDLAASAARRLNTINREGKKDAPAGETDLQRQQRARREELERRQMEEALKKATPKRLQEIISGPVTTTNTLDKIKLAEAEVERRRAESKRKADEQRRASDEKARAEREAQQTAERVRRQADQLAASSNASATETAKLRFEALLGGRDAAAKGAGEQLGQLLAVYKAWQPKIEAAGKELALAELKGRKLANQQWRTEQEKEARATMSGKELADRLNWIKGEWTTKNSNAYRAYNAEINRVHQQGQEQINETQRRLSSKRAEIDKEAAEKSAAQFEKENADYEKLFADRAKLVEDVAKAALDAFGADGDLETQYQNRSEALGALAGALADLTGVKMDAGALTGFESLASYLDHLTASGADLENIDLTGVERLFELFGGLSSRSADFLPLEQARQLYDELINVGVAAQDAMRLLDGNKSTPAQRDAMLSGYRALGNGNESDLQTAQQQLMGMDLTNAPALRKLLNDIDAALNKITTDTQARVIAAQDKISKTLMQRPLNELEARRDAMNPREYQQERERLLTENENTLWEARKSELQMAGATNEEIRAEELEHEDRLTAIRRQGIQDRAVLDQQDAAKSLAHRRAMEDAAVKLQQSELDRQHQMGLISESEYLDRVYDMQIAANKRARDRAVQDATKTVVDPVTGESRTTVDLGAVQEANATQAVDDTAAQNARDIAKNRLALQNKRALEDAMTALENEKREQRHAQGLMSETEYQRQTEAAQVAAAQRAHDRAVQDANGNQDAIKAAGLQLETELTRIRAQGAVDRRTIAEKEADFEINQGRRRLKESYGLDGQQQVVSGLKKRIQAIKNQMVGMDEGSDPFKALQAQLQDFTDQLTDAEAAPNALGTWQTAISQLGQDFATRKIDAQQFTAKLREMNPQLLQLAASAEKAGDPVTADGFRKMAQGLRAMTPETAAVLQKMGKVNEYLDYFQQIAGGLSKLTGALGEAEQDYDRVTGAKLQTPWKDMTANLDGASNAAGKLMTLATDVMKIIANPADVGAWVSAITTVVSSVADAIAGFQKAEKELANVKADFAEQNPFLIAENYQKAHIRSRGWLADTFGGGPEVVNEIDKIGLHFAQTMQEAFKSGITSGLKEALLKNDYSAFSAKLKESAFEGLLDGVVSVFVNDTLLKNILGPAIKAWSDALKTPDAADDVAALNGIDMAMQQVDAQAQRFYTDVAPRIQEMQNRWNIGQDGQSMDGPDNRALFGNAPTVQLGIPKLEVSWPAGAQKTFDDMNALLTKLDATLQQGITLNASALQITMPEALTKPLGDFAASVPIFDQASRRILDAANVILQAHGDKGLPPSHTGLGGMT